MPERTLVTGALGCVGAWTLKALLELGEEPVGYDLGRDDSRLRESLKRSYLKLNASSLEERPAADELQWLRDFYAPTLPPLRALLEAHGSGGLPDWLAPPTAPGPVVRS